MNPLRIVDKVPGGRRVGFDRNVMVMTDHIMFDVRGTGEAGIRRWEERHGLKPEHPIRLERDDLDQALERLPHDQRQVLERVAGRIRAFAEEQRKSLVDLDIEVTGGRAGHRWIPVETVGAYAPGGRYPLPSSVLMTVIPAKVAGVETVWVASPKPTDITLAAAAVAGADGLLPFGGASAIASLAYGVVSPRCDLIVGPGNKYVTAAKKLLMGVVGIDALAGPSEILVIADRHADPALIAADLLAQAEHDEDAVPMLITTSQSIITFVGKRLQGQLRDLPTSRTAEAALKKGFAMQVRTMSAAASASNSIAPEHLALHVDDPGPLLEQLKSYGSLFIGGNSAEVFADYGVGPNHVLPTGGGARFQSGLSVMTYLRSPTWSRLDDPSLLIEDTVLLARLEGLEAHARAALRRAGE